MSRRTVCVQIHWCHRKTAICLQLETGKDGQNTAREMRWHFIEGKGKADIKRLWWWDYSPWRGNDCSGTGRKYLLQKTGVRHNTEANYKFVVNIIKKEDFGKKRIDKIKLSDAKCWLIKLQQDGRGYSSIHSVRGVVRPAFQMAVDDDLIRKNPFEF